MHPFETGRGRISRGNLPWICWNPDDGAEWPFAGPRVTPSFRSVAAYAIALRWGANIIVNRDSAGIVFDKSSFYFDLRQDSVD